MTTVRASPEDYYAALQDQRNSALDQLVNAQAEIAALKRELSALSDALQCAEKPVPGGE